MADSLELARALEAEGVETVAATPHLRHDFPDVRPHELEDRCIEVQASLDGASIRLQVVPGAEVDLGAALDIDAESLRLVSIGQRGHCVLVETPFGPLSGQFED